MSEIMIRFATPADADTIMQLVRELAVFERLEHQVSATTSDFRRILENASSGVEVLLAQKSDRSVGFALFFRNFSTFLGKPGMYLEDIFVDPKHRNQGIATLLFRRLLEIARERGYGRVDWMVLEWNEKAIRFYTERIGAEMMTEWRICRVVL